MDGWIVRPDAPVLEPDWRAQFLEAAAAGLYQHWSWVSTLQRDPGTDRGWSELSPEERQPWCDQAAAAHGAGRYVVRPDGREADWVAEA
jgi:hypothetical protein